MRVPGTILTVGFIKKSNPTSIHLGCVNFKLRLHENWRWDFAVPQCHDIEESLNVMAVGAIKTVS